MFLSLLPGFGLHPSALPGLRWVGVGGRQDLWGGCRLLLTPQHGCNAPTGVKGQTLAKRVRLLGKLMRSYGKPERRGVVSPKMDVQAWPLSNTTVQEELL